MDVHSPEKRSFNMSRIKGKDTVPEKLIRRWLWAKGYRYRLHRKDLAGKPDIVLPRHGAAIFVHGLFLAPARMPSYYNSSVAPMLLERQVSGKCQQGQAENRRTAE